MKKINLAITGCMGRMGQQLIKSANKNNFFKIISLTESKKLNKKILGIMPELNSIKAFKKANIIILDEATSALDNITEKKIIENILQDPNRTVIMVSHSTESIKECDIIYEIENGKIKNFGNFEELIKISKSFRELSASDN